MKITQLLCKDTPSISFEVFPPKTESGFESVKAATEQIARLKPAYMSVTYGAGGGTSRYTLDIARNIEKSFGVPTLGHLTCVSSTRQTVLERIRDIRQAGIENVMALRGDIPAQLLDADRTGWDYRHAIDLVRQLRQEAPGLCIGGACYPETHPESPDQATDIRHLKEKVEAGCDFLTTQMFFDNRLFLDFVEKLRKAGIFVPVIPGIMPITNITQVERAVKLSGSYLPPEFLRLVDTYGSDPEAMKQAGLDYATEQLRSLYGCGVTNVHVYTMNKPDVAETILGNLQDVLGKERL